MHFFFVALLFASLGRAQEEYKCDFDGVRSVKTKLSPQSEKTFDFKYQVVGNIDPEKFVIIKIPGGPGGSAINDFTDELVKKSIADNETLPESIPWIMIDPRTVGCNRGEETKFPDDSLTSDNLAHDILSIIEDLKLKKYILFGHSYGSQSATYVAGLAEARGLPAPHAVVLSGILGFGKEDGSFSIPNQKIFEWNHIKTKLSPKVLGILKQEAPLGFEANQWAGVISRALYSGAFWLNDELVNPFIGRLQSLDSDNPEDHKSLLRMFGPRGPKSGSGDFSSRLFREVDCHEYSPADGGVFYKNGELFFDVNDDPCAGEPFDRKYDSREYQMNSHIYYLAGTRDVAAPYEGARYHFENQHSSRRNFMTVEDGGHTNYGWVMEDCKDMFWDKVLKQEDLIELMPNCKAPLKLEVR